MKDNQRYKNRSNLWCFVIYPKDSCPKYYCDIIQSWHIPVLLSPIHDKDKNGDLTEKKVHQHVMIYFGVGCNKSFDQVKKYCDELNGTIPIIVQNRNAMIRYFIHIDNPEKTQYNRSDLSCFSGFEIGNAFDSWSNDQQLFEYIEDIIFDHKITNFADLVWFLKDCNLLSELSFIRTHTFYINALLTGLWQKHKNLEKLK